MKIQVVIYEGYDPARNSYQVRLENGQIEYVPRQAKSVVIVALGQNLLLYQAQENSPGYLIPIL